VKNTLMREKILERGIFFVRYFPTVAFSRGYGDFFYGPGVGFFRGIRQWFLDREAAAWWHRIGCGGGVDRGVV
jgi:hypothetical protein